MQLSETTEVTATNITLRALENFPSEAWLKPILDSKFIGWRQVR